MRRNFALVLLAIAGICTSLAGQQRPRPPEAHAPTPMASVAQAPAPIAPLNQGDVEGFVYWDANTIQHNPPGTCAGLAVKVSAAGSSDGVVPLGNNFKYAGQVKAFLYGGKVAVYDVCIYAYDHQPVGPDLQAQLILTQPNTFSPAVSPQVGTVAPIKIINAKCNMLPPIVPSTVSELTAHWGSCQNRAFEVNFELVPSTHMLSASGPGGMLSGGNSGATNPGPQQRPAVGMLQSTENPGSTSVTSPGQLLPARPGTNANAVALNPQPYPPKGTSTRPPGSNPLLSATEQTPATTERGKTLASHLKLVPGPKIRISNNVQQGLDPVTTQTIQSERLETHNTKVALAKGLKVSNLQSGTHTLDSTDPAGSVPGNDPSGGQPGSSGGSSGGGSVQVAGNPPTQARTGSSHLSIQQIERAPQPMSMCRFTTDPVIETVGGKNRNIVLTPDPGTGQYPNNQYAIVGCNFGAIQGDVHIFGSFINNPSPVKLGIDSWADSAILVTFNPTFQNEYDLKNITLVVVRSDGKSFEMPGLSFVATRASRQLASIPRSLVKLPTDYFQNNQLVSPLTYANLQHAGLSPVAQTGTAAFYLYDPIWSSNVGDGYPPNRLSFSDAIDFSQLRSGFTLDGNLQTLVLGNPTLDYSSLDSSGCKYIDTPLSASMQGSTLMVNVQPAECDNYGKFIYAYYGLLLSVTGPKGDLLNPWPDGLQ